MAIDLGDGIDLGLGLDLGEGINLDAGLVNPNQVIQQQEPKGFFATLRNPIELMRYESLPVAAYQGIAQAILKKYKLRKLKILYKLILPYKVVLNI